MTNNPQDLLTFVIPAYKEPEYINILIESLQNQSLESSIILTTSTPNDYLRSICEKYQIKYIVNNNTKNSIADDWNFALSQVKTKYAVIGHQDDIYNFDFATKLIEKAEKYSGNLITFSFYNELDSEGIKKHSPLTIVKKIILSVAFFFGNSASIKFFKKITVRFGSAIPCPAVMYNLDNIGYEKFNDSFKVNLDWDFWYRLSTRKGQFVYLRENLMTHRLHNQSATFAGINSNIRAAEDKIMFDRMWISPINKIIAKLYSKSYESNTNI